MRIYIKTLLLASLAFWAGGLGLVAQTGEGLMRRGDHQAQRFAYSRAIDHYIKYLRKNPGSREAMEKLGDCYMQISRPDSAEAWYALALESGAANEYRFRYATALLQNGEVEQADAEIQRFLAVEPGHFLGKVMHNSTSKYNNFLEDSLRYRVTSASINREGADFGAVAVKGKIYIASDRGDDEWIFTWLGHHFLDLYEADPAGLSDIGTPRRVKGLANTKYHEAIASFSPSADTVYFTRNNFHKGKVGRDDEGTMLLKTYFAKVNGGKWSGIKEMNFNSRDYSAGHPALFDGGKKMIFVSDMPGTSGGTDLYVTTLEGDVWGVPVNLGAGFNSPGNEMFPWIDAAGNLFYASNGLEGMGGLDVFYCARKGDSWAAPLNLGYPINTPRDDFSLALNDDGISGYVSSNRIGGKGDDDIYCFRAARTVYVDVVDAKTGLVIKDAVGWVKSGKPIVSYGASAEQGRMHFYADPSENLVVEYSKEGYDNVLDVVPMDEGSVFDPIYRVVKMNSGGEKPVECEEWVILDGKIITNGLDLPNDTKITVKEKASGVPIRQNLTFNYTLSKGKDYLITLESDSMETINYELSTKTSNSFDTINVEIPLIPSTKELGKVFYVIYYNYDKFDIRMDASEELDRVVRFMKKYPHIKVEMGSHTDARGTDDYNMGLSRNRAQQAHKYLVEHGIAADRIRYIWFGEQNLANGCDNGVECPESMHQMNRRTEFKLIGL